MKVIAFSLWGDDPKYNVGAIENYKLAQEIYPGWRSRFYVGASVPSETIDGLMGAGLCVDDDGLPYINKNSLEIVYMPEDGNWTGMFWRFAPASEPDVEVMISRDTDSRLSRREKDAVDEWLASPAGFHIMRDHPWHTSQILGGMWGAKRGAIPDMDELMSQHDQQNYWQIDQEFLNSIIYPRVACDAMIHDDFGLIHGERPHTFPSPRCGLEFVGSVFDENDETIAEHAEMLRRCLPRG